jgi:diguanylate cyclase (GGDEF)-like protein
MAAGLDARRKVSMRLVGAVAIADLTAIFGVCFLITPPEFYARALIIAFFSAQLTFVDFGLRAARLSLASIALGYVAMCALAMLGGARVAWVEEVWTLFIFLFGSSIVVQLHGTIAERLDGLATLFARAEEGDFEDAYDESADRHPDAITVVGRAYNRMRTQLATIVLTDPLSGCQNRRGFELELAREASRAFRGRSDLAVLAIDVDHFKEINDVYGHLAGDEAIREIGAVLRTTARVTDVVARTGGDEFMILAPHTDGAGAIRLASRISEAFRLKMFASVDNRHRITVSIGCVSDRVADERLAEGLRARADEALYAAKRSGRDRICTWTRGMPPASLTPVTSLRLEKTAASA